MATPSSLQRIKNSLILVIQSSIEKSFSGQRLSAMFFIQDLIIKLTIPAIVKSNPQCDPKSFCDDISVFVDKKHSDPKNQMVVKTIYRKGFTDDNKPILNTKK
jgi:hypothetical protein